MMPLHSLAMIDVKGVELVALSDEKSEKHTTSILTSIKLHSRMFLFVTQAISAILPLHWVPFDKQTKEWSETPLPHSIDVFQSSAKLSKVRGALRCIGCSRVQTKPLTLTSNPHRAPISCHI